MTATTTPRAFDHRGRTAVKPRALHSLTRAVVRDAAGLTASDVSVRLSDQRGKLAVTVAVPVTVDDDQTGSLIDRGGAVRTAVVDRLDRLAARRVAVVDVRYAGVRVPTAKRAS